ncbi:MAG: hypothetical protein VX951_02525, partial [Planctomycetota bacterium]|nr:hypothetical protein [Planctomycetota bacterium]
ARGSFATGFLFAVLLVPASLPGQYRGATPRPTAGHRPTGQVPRPTPRATRTAPTVAKKIRPGWTATTAPVGRPRGVRPALKNLVRQPDWIEAARRRHLQQEMDRRERSRQSRRTRQHVEAAPTASPTLESVEIDAVSKATARKTARAFLDREFKGPEVVRGIRKVTKLRWHSKLTDAASRARASGRPILWIQALGDIGGYT